MHLLRSLISHFVLINFLPPVFFPLRLLMTSRAFLLSLDEFPPQLLPLVLFVPILSFRFLLTLRSFLRILLALISYLFLSLLLIQPSHPPPLLLLFLFSFSLPPLLSLP